MGGRRWAGWSGVKGGKWDKCNSIINKIYFLKNDTRIIPSSACYYSYLANLKFRVILPSFFSYFHQWVAKLFWIKLLNSALAGRLSASLQTKGSLVQFPVRAHAWVGGRVPSGGCVRGNHTLMFFFLSFSLPSPL